MKAVSTAFFCYKTEKTCLGEGHPHYLIPYADAALLKEPFRSH